MYNFKYYLYYSRRVTYRESVLERRYRNIKVQSDTICQVYISRPINIFNSTRYIFLKLIGKINHEICHSRNNFYYSHNRWYYDLSYNNKSGYEEVLKLTHVN